MIQTRLTPLDKQLIFFADAPIDYPYRIANYDNKNRILKANNLKLGIIDQGVYTYIITSEDHDYPSWLIEGMFKLSEKAPANILISSCDYPGLSFESGREHILTDYDNVHDTIKNWEVFKKSRGSNRVIYTLQLTTNTSFKQVKDDLSNYPEPYSKYIGIGSMCRIMGSKKEKEFFTNVVRFVRTSYPNHFIHVWGASLFHLNSLRNYVDSFDSAKWTRPVSHKKLKANWGCKNQSERIAFFEAYLDRIYINKKEEIG